MIIHITPQLILLDNIGRQGGLSGVFEFSSIFEYCILIWRPGTMWKSFLGAVRFILTKCDPISSHGDPIHIQRDRYIINYLQFLTSRV